MGCNEGPSEGGNDKYIQVTNSYNFCYVLLNSAGQEQKMVVVGLSEGNELLDPTFGDHGGVKNSKMLVLTLLELLTTGSKLGEKTEAKRCLGG